MDAPCDQLQSKKVSHCAWSICRDVDQVLRNQKSFRCSCYGALQARGQFIESAQSPIYVFFGRFTHRALARKICQDLLDLSFWWSKRLHFGQITLFREFSCFGCGRDIWPMIDYLAVVGEFPCGFSSPRAMGGGVFSWGTLSMWFVFRFAGAQNWSWLRHGHVGDNAHLGIWVAVFYWRWFSCFFPNFLRS